MDPVLLPEAGLADTVIGEQPLTFGGFVVAIGASAGGLDALERLFGALPVDTGAAFVVIQHLSPDHKSMMDNLLARYTAMPVQVAGHDMPLAPNAVFLIPPAKSMRIAGDRLLLTPKPEHGLSLPIDVFFTSMAEQCADRGIAVVLSGTGSDGSRGIPAVNAAGGFVFVQEPADAKFDGMPRSAVGTGLADVVAPAEALAERLSTHLRAPRHASMRLLAGSPPPGVAEPLEGILELLLGSSGIDFRDYKPTTVLRRIERRMQVQRTASLPAYREALAGSVEEQAVLRRELLIPVTRFFRDADVFEHLAEQVIGPLVGREATMEPIRVWVACCATGEEAYSIAILFAEAFQRLGRMRPVKIFATDVEQHYLDQAGAGHYPDTIAAEVSGQRLERWFMERDGGWTVRPEIRQMVIFARHNLVADPPFTRMDLVTCRNALIYFQPGAQERAMRRLQYALQPGGHLLLGPSESLGVLHRDFAALPGRGKIYRLLRRDRLGLQLDSNSRHETSSQRRATRRRPPEVAPPSAQAWVTQGERQLQQVYLPPSLLVGPSRELLHVYGSASELLQISEGQMTLDVLKLLPRELSWAAGLLLQAVATEDRAESSAPVRLGQGEGARQLRVVARRMGETSGTADAGGAPVTLLSFEPLELPMLGAAQAAELDEEQRKRVEALERELDLTHESLQATIEELETANEELQATNEELMASNEELQSTNEELQSVNEELYTVNSEYQEKVDVLNSVNADLENVAKATATPTLFVDEQLRLLRFTPELMQLFKVREGDRGRSLEDFANLLDYPELFNDLRRTMADKVVNEREVRSRDGQWWLARMQPYAARVPGSTKAVMSFVNVTSLKDSQRMQSILDSLAEHLAVLDAQGNIVRVNEAWRRFAADNGDPDLRHSGPGHNYLSACASAALVDPDARRAHEGVTAVLRGHLPRFTMQYPCDSKGQRLWFLMHAAPVAHAGGGAVVSHIEITAWVDAQLQPGTGTPLEDPAR
ncbi:chemotaxis protein CheB [Rubrivivax rivuli]|uniref:chemotaxis protein CheB n=1 Tax=Rubrivivax rivuli TaxID=1862385 RepID=UPI001FDEBCFE|nr:chemotaxis protein CheB [Rubrivivax rivuli]